MVTGSIPSNSWDASITVPFHKPFKDTNYNCFASLNNQVSNPLPDAIQCGISSNSAMWICVDHSGQGLVQWTYSAMWLAVGFVR